MEKDIEGLSYTEAQLYNPKLTPEQFNLERHLRIALDKVLLAKGCSTWGKQYSINREEDRKACIEDLIEKLILPMLKELGPSFEKEGLIPSTGW